jgi:hypothetical protein
MPSYFQCPGELLIRTLHPSMFNSHIECIPCFRREMGARMGAIFPTGRASRDRPRTAYPLSSIRPAASLHLPS